MHSITGLRNIVENIKDKHMETLDLIIGKSDRKYFEWAAKDFSVKVTFSNNRACLSGGDTSQFMRVAFMAGYYKANEMHKTLNK